MKKKGFLLFVLMAALIVACTEETQKQGIKKEGIQSAIKEQTASVGYQHVRIKKFPFAVQCWTFRKFSFFETLEKVKNLGIKYIQAYPDQVLSKDLPGVKFSHDLDEEQIGLVKKGLKEKGLEIVGYGVVGFENNEESMRRVFNFAKTLGIRTIVTEPEYDDYSLLDRMAREYNINIAVHNHPVPSKYARPETVLEHVKNCSECIGSCADTGHWMRTGIIPVEAVKLLKGRILDVHLKDLNEFGTKEAYDVPFGQGKANIHDVLAELTLQNYGGFLSIEYENEKEIYNPSPSIIKGIEYIKSITE